MSTRPPVCPPQIPPTPLSLVDLRARDKGRDDLALDGTGVLTVFYQSIVRTADTTYIHVAAGDVTGVEAVADNGTLLVLSGDTANPAAIASDISIVAAVLDGTIVVTYQGTRSSPQFSKVAVGGDVRVLNAATGGHTADEALVANTLTDSRRTHLIGSRSGSPGHGVLDDHVVDGMSVAVDMSGKLYVSIR